MLTRPSNSLEPGNPVGREVPALNGSTHLLRMLGIGWRTNAGSWSIGFKKSAASISSIPKQESPFARLSTTSHHMATVGRSAYSETRNRRNPANEIAVWRMACAESVRRHRISVPLSKGGVHHAGLAEASSCYGSPLVYLIARAKEMAR